MSEFKTATKQYEQALKCSKNPNLGEKVFANAKRKLKALKVSAQKYYDQSKILYVPN